MIIPGIIVAFLILIIGLASSMYKVDAGETAKKWNGVLPTYIPQGTVMPFVQLPQK